MYEEMTYERIHERALARVNPKYDKREGSIIGDTTGAISFEMAELYIMAKVIMNETFATTAGREYLMLRAAEFNIVPELATAVELEGEFSKAIPIGSRFNFEQYNFTVTELINDDAHTYKLLCEQPGRGANGCIGDIIPMQPIEGLAFARTIKIIRPGEDEEETEVFRKRFFDTIKSKAYGGNGDDYKEKVLRIPGVGAVKVYRCPDGGGTVHLVVMDTEFRPASDALVSEIQEKIDPPPQGKGYGIAPIGHIVTVKKPTEVPINVSANVSVKTGRVEDIKGALTSVLDSYFLDKRKEWAKQSDREGVIIRPSFILAKLLEVSGVADITDITVNDSATKIDLTSDAVPVLGTVNFHA